MAQPVTAPQPKRNPKVNITKTRPKTAMSNTRDIQLIEAVENGQAPRVRQLLADGANPNARKRVTLTCRIGSETKTDTAECESALALGILHANEDIVNALLEGGADANGVCGWKIADSWPLWTADRWSRRRWLRTILFSSALTLAVARGGKETWCSGDTGDLPNSDNQLGISLKGGDMQIWDPNKRKDTCISPFTLHPSLPIVKLLLSHGAVVTERELDAAYKQPDGRFLQMLQNHQFYPPTPVPSHTQPSSPPIIAPSSSPQSEPSSPPITAPSYPQPQPSPPAIHISSSNPIIPPAAEIRPQTPVRPVWHIHHTDVEVGEKLGQGSFGIVYKCEWSGITVAGKYLLLDTSPSEQPRESYKVAFDREVTAWHTAGYHPNIVPLIGASWESSHPLFLSKFMKNGDVVSFLQKNPVFATLKMKLRILCDIAAGMLYLHDIRNIVHADLKPQNTLVDDDYTTLVTDFGTAKIVDLPPSEATGMRIGTSAYMPPERLLGSGATKKGDVYAFGVTVFRIWTGRIPYSEDEFNGLPLDSIADRRRKLRPLILESDIMPESLEQLVEECWDHFPAKRPVFGDILKRLKEIRETL
ncbi:hypothetical protein HDU93_004871 [Gonapodya sp. JEL0774]|nr:hypothetical protein HDU93_004871 [Gonapodya sp. JEL0774]